MDNKENTKKAYEELLKRAVGLYTKGTLRQYGLNDKQALDIVHSLTSIPREKLIALKDERGKSAKTGIDNAFETLMNLF